MRDANMVGQVEENTYGIGKIWLILTGTAKACNRSELGVFFSRDECKKEGKKQKTTCCFLCNRAARDT